MIRYYFRVYRDRKKEWRWALVARNGRKIANGGEGYQRRGACIKAVHTIKEAGADNAPVLDEKGVLL